MHKYFPNKVYLRHVIRHIMHATTEMTNQLCPLPVETYNSRLTDFVVNIILIAIQIAAIL